MTRMTNKYLSTELLVLFTALMIIANFYYIFFEKIGFLLVLLVGCIMVYIGYLYFHKVRGLLVFWIGILMILFTLLSNKYTLMVLFLFLIIIMVRFIVYKKRPLMINATNEEVDSPSFIKQKWFGDQKTPFLVYKWEDVQVQHAIGDIHLDLTKAANIRENNTIVIRNVIGRTQIIVPLNYNINLHMAAFYGNAKINEKYYKVQNTHVHIDERNNDLNSTINVYVSNLIGDVEVIYR